MSLSDNEPTRVRHSITQGTAEDARFKDAQQRCATIVGDRAAHWLIRQVEALQHSSATIRSGTAKTYRFLSSDPTDVMRDEVGTATVITMPPGSIVSKVAGSEFRSWVFRVDNGQSGSDREFFDLEYRTIAPDAHMLSLKAHGRGEQSRP